MVTTISYSYRRGSNANNAPSYAYGSPRQGSTTTTGPTNQTVANGTTAGTTSSTSTTWTRLSGNGQNTIWEGQTTTTQTTHANVVVTTTETQASLTPGTYADLQVSCKTVFSSGVYILNGGQLKIPGQYQVTGSGIMFVLKGGASIHINGGSNVNLTAITAAELMAQGVDSVEANKLAGMLVFEDRSSTAGANANKLNGNASTVLNGTIYLPNSHISFQGTATVTSQCLMIAANMITITGNRQHDLVLPGGLDRRYRRRRRRRKSEAGGVMAMRGFLHGLAADARGSMAIETAFVVPVLAVMSIGGFEVSGMVSRQSELQSAVAEAAQIAIASAPDEQSERNTIKEILMASADLPASKVTLSNEYRCNSNVAFVSSEAACATSDSVTTYLKIYVTDTYTPEWTKFGVGRPLTYRITRRVIVGDE